MFSADCGSLSGEEIRDAFCEIANMIGGNIKGSLAEEADLSLPVIGEAHNRLKHLPCGSLENDGVRMLRSFADDRRARSSIPVDIETENAVLTAECQ